MISYLNKSARILIPVIIFFTIIYTGCSTGGNIETVDSKTLKDDADDIKYILNFRLKDGRSFSDSSRTGIISLDFKHGVIPQICYFKTEKGPDSLSRYYAAQTFNLEDVSKAIVLYKKDNSLGLLAGGALAIGLVVFLFWANGERNKRP